MRNIFNLSRHGSVGSRIHPKDIVSKQLLTKKGVQLGILGTKMAVAAGNQEFPSVFLVVQEPAGGPNQQQQQ